MMSCGNFSGLSAQGRAFSSRNSHHNSWKTRRFPIKGRNYPRETSAGRALIRQEYHVPKDKQKGAIKKRNDTLYDFLWKSFELSLGEPDEGEIESACRSAVEAMGDIEFGGIEDTLNAFFDDQFRFIQKLQAYLLRWTKQIRLNKAPIKCLALKDNRSGFFLTFNYTPVLERIYGISTSQICHIHGGVPPYCGIAPVIGHGNGGKIEHYKELQRQCGDVLDEGGSSTNRAFADFYQRTYKDTDRALLQNLNFFSKLHEIDAVEIIGHSLGSVDMPYFEEIKRRVSDDTKWTVYYHSENEKDNLKASIESIDVSELRMRPSAEFWDSDR